MNDRERDMQGRGNRGLSGLPFLAGCIVALLCVPAATISGSPAVAGGEHRCVRLQAWFGEQMASHGYGNMTFRYEADANGAPVVHRLDGAHADRYYDDRTTTTVQREVREAFDPNNVVLFVVIDNRWGDALGPFGAPAGRAAGGKDGGWAVVPGGFEFWVAAHELAHAFGMLWHDHREGGYILAIFRGSERLSACSAAFLSMQPFFNAQVPLGWDWDTNPTVELLSPLWYDEGSERITVRLKVEAPHGLHQLVILVPPLCQRLYRQNQGLPRILR